MAMAVAGTSIPRGWISGISDVLEPEEEIEFAVAEHRIVSPRPFARAIIFCTDKRIIILRKGMLGTYRTYKIIHYDEVVQVVLHGGLYYSRLHFGLRSEESETDERKRWVWGLDPNEAKAIVHFVERRHIAIEMEERVPHMEK
jgi:hypothetical protein